MAQELTLQAVSGITDPDQIRITLYINNQQVHAPLVDVVVVASAGTYLPLAGGTLTGALTGTEATFSGLLTTNGQIAFPAVQNPSANVNTLDDYEEGTFTPAFAATVGTITTLGANTGFYVKIGRVVHWWTSTVITTNGTGATSITISNLPFTAASVIAPAYGRSNAVGGFSLNGFIGIGTTTVTIFKYDATYPGASGATIVMAGSYLT